MDAGEKVKVKVPYAPKGSVLGSAGRAGVLRGGPKSIVNRAANALGVAAQWAGNALNAVDGFKYAKSSVTAFSSGDNLTGWHDLGMSGLSFIGLAPGIGKAAPYLGTATDVGTKLYFRY